VISLGFWDAALLVIVSSQATLLAYLSHPRWKALIMALPIPFTLAALAVGAPVNVSHVVALNVLLAFTHGVRWLHHGAKLPIIPSIALSAAGYCLAGALLKSVLPQSELAFWTACVLTFLVAVAAHALFPRPDEPDHRSPLHPWLKFPMVAGVVAILILMKQMLQGFTTMFPMVGVFAAYEGRTCLGTICRTLPDFMLGMVPMLAVVRLAQPRLGLGPALAVGWLVFISVLFPLIREFWKAPKNAAAKTG
jgi:hypothetical protein